MKITGMRVTPIAVPMKGEAAQSKIRLGPALMQAVILELYTDEGYVGLAEVPIIAGASLACNFVMSAEKKVIGRDPHDVNGLLKELYASYNLYHFHMHAGNWALNSVERACWDILGQKAGLPLYKLWGGAFRKEAEIFGVVDAMDDLDAMGRAAAQKAQQGYKVLFCKVGFGDVDRDIEVVKAIRRGLADSEVKIRVDPNQCWSVGEAIYAAERMYDYGMDCIDQPTQMYNLEALKSVKDASPVPIASHESTWTLHDTLRIIKSGAVDIITLDPRFDAGYYGIRVSAGLAEAAGIPIICHAYHELGLAISERMQIIAACPAFTMTHQWGEYDNVTDDVINERPVVMDGKVQISDRPGVGVTLNRDKLQQYHEVFIREIQEPGLEISLDNPLYQAMYARPYLKSILDN
ncbi:mandelate racemase/muconate lactonizing enzyme family protein [Anaerotruncus rubiinfantis]|uniref:mandelate racemase/muconate lactonizing enzyme family protein n=1 Tax=Anaerotruncus rubiinfantis TaxID=1720200 RepID=UPI0034A4A0F4